MLAIGVIGFAAAAATLPDSGGHAFDNWAHTLLGDWRSEGVTKIFELLSTLGSTAVIIAITLAAAGWFGYRYGWRYSGILFGSVLAAYLLNTLLKNVFDRVRPDSAWGITADGASFPSGNAMLGIVMFGMIIIVLLRESRWNKPAKLIAAIVLSLLIILMGVSRIYFHVHYITDVLAGYSAGLVVISTTLLLEGAFLRKRGN